MAFVDIRVVVDDSLGADGRASKGSSERGGRAE